MQKLQVEFQAGKNYPFRENILKSLSWDYNHKSLIFLFWVGFLKN